MKRDRGRIAGLVLAAGYSNRMGAFKPLLPLGNSTIIERAVGIFLKAGVQDVRVVVGWQAGELIPVLDRLGVRIVHNPHYAVGMYSSVVAGVTSLDPEVAAFLLLPADTPLVKPQTVQALVDCYLEGQAGIVYPRFRGRRGHPPLIAKKYVEHALSADQPEDLPGGLRAVLGRHESVAADIDVTDPGVVMDVDTPADYQAALAYVLREDGPATNLL